MSVRPLSNEQKKSVRPPLPRTGPSGASHKWGRLLILRTIFRIVCSIVVALGCEICLSAPPTLSAPAADGFRSELWRMEFEKTEDEDDSEKALPTLEDSGNAGVLRPRSTDDVSEEGQVVIPGQIRLQELQEETPFAEWQVDEAAGRSDHPHHEEASAWTMSQASGSQRDTLLGNPKANGPTVLTFLVALVAGVVMIGTFFSGRE
jgi:hypothetical protein